MVAQAKTYLRDMEGHRGELVVAYSKKMGWDVERHTIIQLE